MWVIERIRNVKELNRCKNTYARLMAEGCGRLYKRKYPKSYESLYEQLKIYLPAEKMALLVSPYLSDEHYADMEDVDPVDDVSEPVCEEVNSIEILDRIKDKYHSSK